MWGPARKRDKILLKHQRREGDQAATRLGALNTFNACDFFFFPFPLIELQTSSSRCLGLGGSGCVLPASWGFHGSHSPCTPSGTEVWGGTPGWDPLGTSGFSLGVAYMGKEGGSPYPGDGKGIRTDPAHASNPALVFSSLSWTPGPHGIRSCHLLMGENGVSPGPAR